LLALAAAQAATPAPCRPDEICEVPLALSAAGADALLGARNETWWVNGEVVTVVARREDGAQTCCAIQQRMHPIGRGLQAVSVRVPDIDSAIFDMMVIPGQWSDAGRRGPRAPPAPPRSPLAEVEARTTFHRIDSVRLGEQRSFFVYVPAGLAEGQRVPVIYMPDGGWPEFNAIADAMARRGQSSPVIMVGIANREDAGPPACPELNCDSRSQELLVDIPEATPEQSRFDARDLFTVEEVMPFVESRYPVLRTPQGRAVLGWSSGGSWALVMAARHPDLFGNVVAFSVGWRQAVPFASRLTRGRALFVAGRLEVARFRERTAEAASLARAAGAEVRLLTPNGGHAHLTWELGLAEALQWMFPATPER